jgi:hypothetical protein
MAALNADEITAVRRLLGQGTDKILDGKDIAQIDATIIAGVVGVQLLQKYGYVSC